MARFIVGVTGASGIILAIKTVAAMAKYHDVELVFSQASLYTALYELGKELATPQKIFSSFPPEIQKRVSLHPIGDMGSSICSGSYQTAGMVVVPCSMATLAALACGLADNVVRRAADVTLKERRPLVIVPREAPFSEIHLENMLKLTRSGSIILPPIPAWYNAPQTLSDSEDFIVGKILDLLKIDHSLYRRWGE